MPLEFKCAICGEVHNGMLSFGPDRVLSDYEVPKTNVSCAVIAVRMMALSMKNGSLFTAVLKFRSLVRTNHLSGVRGPLSAKRAMKNGWWAKRIIL